MYSGTGVLHPVLCTDIPRLIFDSSVCSRFVSRFVLDLFSICSLLSSRFLLDFFSDLFLISSRILLEFFCALHDSPGSSGHREGSTCEDCVSGYYGQTCTECPGFVDRTKQGLASQVCSGHGKCDQGIGGKGNCTCENGFYGIACATCRDSYCPMGCSGHG